MRYDLRNFSSPFRLERKASAVLLAVRADMYRQNFMQKAGAMKLAAELGMAIVRPIHPPVARTFLTTKKDLMTLALGQASTPRRRRGISITKCIAIL